jgi:hypothetical protein
MDGPRFPFHLSFGWTAQTHKKKRKVIAVQSKESEKEILFFSFPLSRHQLMKLLLLRESGREEKKESEIGFIILAH